MDTTMSSFTLPKNAKRAAAVVADQPAREETASEFVRRRIRATVKNPETAELLCPNDHPIGTKRLILDTD
jgi:cation diffusion facilitator CzcD-associated flavoprotein CzcO